MQVAASYSTIVKVNGSAQNEISFSSDPQGQINATKTIVDYVNNKLSGIASGAEVNVQSDWNQTNISADDYIKNKPVLTTITWRY